MVDEVCIFPQGNDAMLALYPNGTRYEWSPNHGGLAYDSQQGPAFHVSKTKDFVSGQRIPRISKIFDTIPVNASLHCKRPQTALA